MKLRRFLIGAIASTLAVTSLGISSFAAKGAVAIDVTAEFQEVADSNEGSTNSSNSGGGTWEMDGTKLKKTGRTNDYDALDIKLEGLADGKYVFEAKASAAGGAIRLCSAASPYGDINGAVVSGNTITFEFTVAGGTSAVKIGEEAKDLAAAAFRIQTDDAGKASDLIIEDVKIYKFSDGTSSTDNGGGNNSNGSTGDTTTTNSGDNKGNTNTGIEGVAAIAGLAILATGAIVISRRK